MAVMNPLGQRTKYEYWSNVTQVTEPNGQVHTYSYDENGRVIEKIKQLKVCADGTTLSTIEWVYEPDSFRPLAQINTDNVLGTSALSYVVTDHAGTPRELCSEQGDIIWRGQHEVWGGYKQQHQQGLLKKYASDAANDPIECDLRYQGQIYDQETGLYYNRHRYYDTDSGQYLSSDPIGFAGGLRPQAYVHNPMDWVDPSGLVLGKTQPASGWNYTNMPKISGYQNHHVIPRSMKAHPALKSAGFDIDGTKNLIYLPKDRSIHPTRMCT